MKLHGYYRSGASWRVRIALNLKGIAVDHVFHHLRKGEQRAPDFLALNPQGLVPALEAPGGVLTQSLAIVEWLDETVPVPALLPRGDAFRRARVRAFAQVIACDTHPVQNLKVLNRLAAEGMAEAAVEAWPRWVIGNGLAACEALIATEDGPFCFGASPGLADLCLVPQLANARRFGLDLSPYPRLLAAEAACAALPAFIDAAPGRQPDAE
ncbi:maleylacetoacetate isomerase [Zavarzinia compransoris]|uniref:Maleylacetoacetate isomerase n=1 Tax=Zavarzinia compransoris TaxID=1264899 RepID=A0A317E6G6_9PROT|nr:maleylacetoacetate isomerase [Zavarzinia compransoris]PWR20993.1 maleylacetoacetate isomerase [Zavarzinia compransoris]